MDIVTLGAALNGSAEYVKSHFKGGANIQIVDNSDGTQTINASGEVSSEDTVARNAIAAIENGENLDSFADVEEVLNGKVDKNVLTENITTVTDPPKHDGYYWTEEQSSNSYFYYHINVNPEDVISITLEDAAQNIRFIDAYNGSTRVADACVNGNTTSYTVPQGVDNIYLSVNFVERYIDLYRLNVQSTVVKGVPELSNRVDYIQAKLGENTIIASKASLGTSETIELTQHADVKKNKVYRFFGKFETFDSITIGQGKNTYGGSWVTIDDTNVTSYYYNGSVIQMNQYTHGLTLSDFIDVVVNVGDVANLRANITIRTNSDSEFSVGNMSMGGCNGAIFANATMAMMDVVYSVSLNDLMNDTWVFGDSYISLGDPNRWAHQMMLAGYTNVMFCGFSGAMSAEQIRSFRELTALRSPKTIVWALGMNDGDDGAVNTSWKNCVEEVIDFCDSHEIRLVLCTIPNVPTVDNTYKNDYVRNSGYRYVDLSKAVNTTGSTWYDGMLSSDNIHPTALGAKTLCYQVLAGVPEIQSGTTSSEGGFAPTDSQLTAMNSGITSVGVAQITTNENNILSLQGKVKAHSEGGTDYDVINGIRVYVSSTAPTGNIPTGSLWIGG